MKRKLRLDELSVASFSTEGDELARGRGTVRGMGDVSYSTCQRDPSCISCAALTCADTCGFSCSCFVTCQVRTCIFTCYESCPDDVC